MLNIEQMIADLLSGDEKRILDASHTIIHSGILNRKLINELYPYLSEIKEKTSNLHYGGTILPNSRFVEKAIRMIEDSVGDKCLCEYLFDGFGQNGKSMVKYGFVLLEENIDRDNYINRSIIECSGCRQQYQVEEEYTGWHITTTRHRAI